MIDSHCHLADTQFEKDRPEVLARARAAGVEKIICIADSLAEGEACIGIAEENEYIFCTVGMHPHHANDWRPESVMQLRELVQRSAKVKAVGEIGLDYHYDNAPRDVQRETFSEQLILARELGLPAVVHCREAVEDVRAILTDGPDVRVVIHCCTETWEDVEPLVAQGHFLSFTGIATYPNAEDIRRTIRMCPLLQLMIETDSPYLAPVPYRGKRNEPAFVAEVLRLVAQEKGMDVAEAEAQTTRNTVAFFGLEP